MKRVFTRGLRYIAFMLLFCLVLMATEGKKTYAEDKPSIMEEIRELDDCCNAIKKPGIPVVTK